MSPVQRALALEPDLYLSLIHISIDNVTITAGVSGASGGGVDNAGGTVTLSNDTLANDTATTSGGGLFNAAGATAVLVNDTLSGDSAGTGGGVDNQGIATFTCLLYTSRCV